MSTLVVNVIGNKVKELLEIASDQQKEFTEESQDQFLDLDVVLTMKMEDYGVLINAVDQYHRGAHIAKDIMDADKVPEELCDMHRILFDADQMIVGNVN